MPVTSVALAGYVVERDLGCGSMGTVHLARRTDWAGRLVAVKRVRHARAGLARTLRHEAEVLAALDHPHIVRILDLVPDGAGVAIAMQFAAGGSVPDLLARRGRLTPGEVVAVAAPVADALASAHRHGLLHCDVKPANILFTSDGEPLLSDFGLARRMAHDGHADPDQPVVGTAEYLDPAVAAGAPADQRSDVYGLGAVCYELLAGAPPYAGSTPDDVLGAALAGPPPPLVEVATGTPPALVHAVERAMARRPADRFADAAAFAAALRAAAPAAAVQLAADGPAPTNPTGAQAAPACGMSGRSATSAAAGAPRNDDAGLVPHGSGEVAACPGRPGPTTDGRCRSDAVGHLGRPTRTFGPRPQKPSALPAAASRCGRRRLLVVAAAAFASATVVVVALGLPSPERPQTGPQTMEAKDRPATAAPAPRPSCPATAGSLQADVDGCPAFVTWRDNVAEVDGRRYQLGRAGDALLVGDWDCNGSGTPALYRPSTGEVFLFDGWAGEGDDLPATDGDRLPAGGRPVVRSAGSGCDRVGLTGASARYA